MSRVGKTPIAVPDGVEVRIAENDITVKGKLGELQMARMPEIRVTMANNEVLFEPEDESARAG